MSDNQWVNQAIAVVAGVVVGYFTAGTASYATYAAIAGLTTYAVTGTVLNYVGGVNRPKMAGGVRPPTGFGNRASGNSTRDAAAASLQVNSASEAVLVPVVFGRCLVSGNFLRYETSTYRSVPIIERVQRDPGTVAFNLAQQTYSRNPSKVDHEVDNAAKKQQGSQDSGGKGGGSPSSPPPSQSYSGQEKVQAYTQVLLEKDANGTKSLPKEYDEFIVGYKYYLSWELGICTGPVDELFTVRVYPGDFLTIDRQGFSALAGTEITFTMGGGEQGGTVRFYPGSHTQVRNVADPYNHFLANYRGTCFAVFQNYYMGQQPSPLSYSFEVGRYPVCLDENGDVIAGMKTRASANPASGAYYDANPAAILWEVFTNKRWGKGLDPALLDQDSFISCSEFFQTEEIGMSFTLETQTLITDAVEQIRSHVQTVVIWSGGKMYCRCLLDRSNAYEPRIRINSDSVSNVSMARPAWPSCPNELRATFLNRYNNYQSEVVIVQDLAGIATQERINSTTVDLPAFSSRATCDKAAKRLLGEVSYPQATLSFKTNRFETRMLPGDFIEFIWGEWSEGDITSFWRVVEISDRDQDNAGIEIKLVEDLYATAYEGQGQAFTPPTPAFEGATTNDDDDVNLAEDLSGPFDGGNLLFQVAELPITLSDADRIFAVFAQRENGQTLGIRMHWRVDGDLDWIFLGQIAPWAITGVVAGGGVPSGPAMTRSATFELELDNEAELGRFLEFASVVPTPSDHIDLVTGSETNLLRIGNEVMQVAMAEEGSTPTRVRITAVIRGQFGTDAAAHADGAEFAFVYQFIPYVMTFRHDAMPINQALEFMATPFDLRGNESTPSVITQTLTNRARKALPIEVWDTTGTAGLDWVVNFRPRFHNRGEGFIGDLDASLNALTAAIPEGYQFYVMPRTAGDVDLLAAPVLLSVAFDPDDGNTPANGKANFTYAAPPTTAKLAFYTAFDGVLGYPVIFEP